MLHGPHLGHVWATVGPHLAYEREKSTDATVGHKNEGKG